MIELIISILLSLGIKVDPTSNSFTFNKDLEDKIKSSSEFQAKGNTDEFSRFVSIDNNSLNDIVITDDDNPKN